MLLYDKIIELIQKEGLINSTIYDLLDENDPKKEDSLSTLITKLSCTTNQMWYSQDILYKIRFMSREQFLIEYGHKIDELHNILKRACDLNVQRAHLMDAIDKKMLSIKKGE